MNKAKRFESLIWKIDVVLVIVLIGVILWEHNGGATVGYKIDKIISSISKDLEVEEVADDVVVNPADILTDYSVAMVYRMKDGEDTFPDYLKPSKIVVDKYDNIILCYNDTDRFADEFEKLKNDESTLFVEEVALDDFVLGDMGAEVNDEILSYAVEMMNSRAESNRLMAMGLEGTITIGVADTGLYSKNSKIMSLVDLANSYDYVNSDNNVLDGCDDKHATQVIACIADVVGNTFAEKHINIINGKCLEYGIGSNYSLYSAICGLADKDGMDIISISLGGPDESELVKFALDYATSKGIIIVCSAGNDASTRISYPAAYNNTIAVSAINANKVLCDFSNRGDKIDVTAYGEGIVVDSVEYTQAIVDGTSFSCPMISAVLAMAKLEDGSIDTKEDAMRYLESVCEDIGDKGKDAYYGVGVPRFEVVEEPEPETEEPTTSKPVIEEPETEETTASKPVIEEPETEETTTSKPVIEEPETEETTTSKPVENPTEEPTTKEPEIEAPIVIPTLGKVKNIRYSGYVENGQFKSDDCLCLTSTLSNRYSFDMVENAHHYEVWYADYNGQSNYNNLNWKLRGLANYNYYYDNELAYGTDILIKVRAVDKHGNYGEFSEVFEIKLLDYDEFIKHRKLVTDTGECIWSEDYYNFAYYRLVLYGQNAGPETKELIENVIVTDTSYKYEKAGTCRAHMAQLLCYYEVIMNGKKEMISIGSHYTIKWNSWY